MSEATSERFISLARITSLAELGYFEDVLHNAGIATRVLERTEFDAVNGHQVLLFVLQVPEEEGSRAAEAMQQEIDRAPEDLPASTSTFGMPDRDSPIWRPFVWLVLAGGVVYWASGLLPPLPRAQPQPAVPPPGDAGPQQLDALLAEFDSPLQAPAAKGEPARQLGFNRNTGRIYLIEDFDGDGAPDRHREFQDGRVVFDRLR